MQSNVIILRINNSNECCINNSIKYKFTESQLDHLVLKLIDLII